MGHNSVSSDCLSLLEEIEMLCVNLSLQLSDVLETLSDAMLDDSASATKEDTILWPDVFRKWESCNAEVKKLMASMGDAGKLLSETTKNLVGTLSTWKLGNLWRNVLSGYSSTLYMLEQLILTILKHISLQWAKDFRGLPLCSVLLDSIAVYNDALRLLSDSSSVHHLQLVQVTATSDRFTRYVSKWDCRESRLRNLQANGLAGRPSNASFNLMKVLSLVAGKRAQGAVLAMMWSLSPFMQCPTVADLDSFALLLKECDNYTGIKFSGSSSELPPVDSSDQLSVLDQTADVVEFSPLKDFLHEEQECLEGFLDELAGISRSFLLPKAGRNGEARVSRYRKLSIWLLYAEQLWKHVAYSVDETLMWDTRWGGYHLPLASKDPDFMHHLSSILKIIRQHVESTLPNSPKSALRSSRELSAKRLSDMSETDIECGKSLVQTLNSLREGVEVVALWQELDVLLLHAQELHYQLRTDLDSSGSHHVLPGEKGVQFFNPFVFQPSDGVKEETLPKIHLLLKTLTTISEVYSYSVEGLLWDSLTSWNIVKYLDISQHSLPMISEKLKCINPLEKMDQKALVDTDSVCAKFTVFQLETLEAHYKSVIRDLGQTSETSFSMFVQTCRRNCLTAAEEVMPKGNFWRKQHRAPGGASSYVPPLVVAVLQPVMDGCKNLSEPSQSLLGQEIVKALCHAMLETILKYELKFNFFGAMQLQQDFNCIKTWVQNHPVISAMAKDEIVANDVFLECEGVTRLLMKQRDWFNTVGGYNQVGPDNSRRPSESVAGMIPPEMYVIHQNLWLRLRVSSDHCLGPFCS